MRTILLFICCFACLSGWTQVLLEADGPGNTYDLITSVLAPGYDPIEAPDCGHLAFGDHIDEIFDEELNTHVFRFFIHTTSDDDRCIIFDRQRNEIKSYDKSPDNLLGIANETVVYKWKFKLNNGFQTSPNFTHLHQLKSVGGALASMPMYTLTARKGSPDRMELRYAETDTQVTLKQTDLAPFIGVWLEVTEKIKYGISGTYEIEIKSLKDNLILLDYSNDAIINWRPAAEFVRPKWGIYRSLINDQDLRDEEVLFASFSIEELMPSAVDNVHLTFDSFKVIPNPAHDFIHLIDLPAAVNIVQVFSLDGKKVMEKIFHAEEYRLDVSSLSTGTYMLHLVGEKINHSKLMFIGR